MLGLITNYGFLKLLVEIDLKKKYIISFGSKLKIYLKIINKRKAIQLRLKKKQKKISKHLPNKQNSQKAKKKARYKKNDSIIYEIILLFT